MTEEEAREYVERWRRAGPVLEKVRRKELRNLTDEQCRSRCQILMHLRETTPSLRLSSGLIEQQSVFMKARQ